MMMRLFFKYAAQIVMGRVKGQEITLDVRLCFMIFYYFSLADFFHQDIPHFQYHDL